MMNKVVYIREGIDEICE